MFLIVAEVIATTPGAAIQKNKIVNDDGFLVQARQGLDATKNSTPKKLAGGKENELMTEELRKALARRIAAKAKARQGHQGLTTQSPPIKACSDITNTATPRSPKPKPIPAPSPSPTHPHTPAALSTSDPESFVTEVIVTAFGTRRVRRIVIPPLADDAPLPSRDARIQMELKSLRAQKKVGGGSAAQGELTGMNAERRSMSLAAMAIVEKVRARNVEGAE